jgi:hypothetical protein
MMRTEMHNLLHVRYAFYYSVFEGFESSWISTVLVPYFLFPVSVAVRSQPRYSTCFSLIESFFALSHLNR